ncbi:MAG: hypothetical protein ACU0C9_08050 [Paracoccaceae bacterium]
MKRSIVLLCALVATPLAAQNFTTAAEVKPIVGAIKGNWIAVRPWEGKDLLYFTNLLSWRCGLSEIRYAINGGEEKILQAEPCYESESAPNALKVTDILPYLTFEADSIETISIFVTYDDGSQDSATFERAAVQIN